MEETARNFIDSFIVEDLSEGHRCYGMKIHTRFPPEPNGYLHIGHCKALTIDFGTAEHFGGETGFSTAPTILKRPMNTR